jgi:quinol monooxygenase YgiN
MAIQSKLKFMRRFLFPMCAVLILGSCGIGAQALAQDSGGHDKIYAVTHVDILPTGVAAGTKLVQQYVADSRKDKGSVRMEAYAQISRVNHLTIVEVWENQAAFDAHVAAAHTKQFRQQFDPMLGSPYDERLHLLLE